MRNLPAIIFLCAVVYVSCKKTNDINANVLLYNASWSLPAVAAAWNSNEILSTPIAQGKSSGSADSPYIKVSAGTNLITVKAGSSTLLDKNIYAAAASGTSFFLFDTSKTLAPVRILQLTDDLNLPDTFKLKYRMLYLVPDTSVKVDVWLVNGTTDSVRLDTAGVFIGATKAAADVQTFKPISFYGGNYTVKIKRTGTQQVYIAVNDYPFAIRGIYSMVFSGLLNGAGNAGLKLSVLRHPSQ
ncbi:MAG: hypothetical protein ABIU63_18250 [Chitinophagaceae bacterium]